MLGFLDHLFHPVDRGRGGGAPLYLGTALQSEQTTLRFRQGGIGALQGMYGIIEDRPCALQLVVAGLPDGVPYPLVVSVGRDGVLQLDGDPPATEPRAGAAPPGRRRSCADACTARSVEVSPQRWRSCGRTRVHLRVHDQHRHERRDATGASRARGERSGRRFRPYPRTASLQQPRVPGTVGNVACHPAAEPLSRPGAHRPEHR
jgi:hypothetical protein